MKKILFHLSSLEQGGAERVVSNLANRLVNDGYNVVVTTQQTGSNEFLLDNKVKRIHVGMKATDADRTRISKAIRRVAYLRKTIKKESPDVVISFLRKPNYRTLLANMGTKIPTIVAIRIDPKSEYNKLTDKILIPLLYPLAKGAVFQTIEQKEFFPKYIQDIATVILNPVHNKYIEADTNVSKENVVVQSGRLVGFKNQLMLLEAFIEVHKKHPDYCLHLYGPDALDGTKKKLEDFIVKNNASDYIQLMGACNELEIVLPKAKVYALSSDYEGMPNALIEAMVLGLPVVSTDCPCGGPRTLINHEENGLLIPVGDADAMARSINRLIENPDVAKKLGDKARNLSDRVNEDAIIGQWKRYIENVYARK